MNAMKATDRTGPGVSGWLNNGQTVTIVGTTLTVAVAIGAMIFASTSAIRMELRTEIQRVDANMTQMRKELSADIEGLREELSADIHRLREELTADIHGLRKELSADIKDVREELSADIKDVREELSADIDGVRAEIKGLDGRLRVVEQTAAAISTRLAVTDTHVPGAGAPPDPAISGHGVAPGSGG